MSSATPYVGRHLSVHAHRPADSRLAHHRRLALGLAGLISAVIAVVALSASPAAGAPTCDTDWTGDGDGFTFISAANWNSGVPDSANHGCIGGNVDVVLTSAVTIEGITIDAGSSLTLDTSGNTNADLNISGPEIVNNGTITLFDANNNQFAEIDLRVANSTLTNNGLIQVTGADIENFILGGIINGPGDVTIDAGNTLQIGADNQTIDLAGTLTIDGSLVDFGGVDLTLDGGAITGSGAALLDAGGSFTWTDGDIDLDGSFQLSSHDVTFNNTGTGTILFDGVGDVSGTIGANQELRLDSSRNVSADAAIPVAGLTNNGTITLFDADNNQFVEIDLSLANSTLTNNGLIQVTGADNENFILGGIINGPGDVTIDAGNTLQIGADNQTIDLTGTLTIDGSLVDSGGVDLTLDSGTITGTGSALLDAGGSLTWTSGDIADTVDFRLHNFDVTFNNTGTGTILFDGVGDVSGTIGANQELRLDSSRFISADAAIPAAGLTNNGTITLFDADNNQFVEIDLRAANSTLTNNGLIQITGADFENFILGGIINSPGDLTIDAPNTLQIGADNQTIDLTGTLTIDGSLVDSGGVDLTLDGGTITGTGSALLDAGGSFTWTGGDIADTVDFRLHNFDVTFNNTGTGTILFDGVGDVSGTIGADQELRLDSSRFISADAAIPAAGLTNNGTITLFDADNNQFVEIDLRAADSTLTNNGLIQVTGADFENFILGGIINSPGDLTIAAPNTLQIGADNQTIDVSGTLTIDGSLVDFGGVDLTLDGGAITGTGTSLLDVSGSDFTWNAGNIADTVDFRLHNFDVDFNGTGTGRIVFDGAGDITGTINPGQELRLDSSRFISADAAIPAAGLTNNGTITLFDADNNQFVEIDLRAADSTLTNNGTIQATGPDIEHFILGGIITSPGDLTVGPTSTLQIGADNQAITTSGSVVIDGTLNDFGGVDLTLDGGAITGTGTSLLDVSGSDFTWNAGNIADTVDFRLHNFDVDFNGAGTGRIVFDGAGDITGTINPGQELRLDSSRFISADAAIPAAGLTNNGTITLFDANNNQFVEIDLRAADSTLTNNGTIQATGPDIEHFILGGIITSPGDLTVGPTSTLQIGADNQTLDLTGAVTIDGALTDFADVDVTLSGTGSGAGGVFLDNASSVAGTGTYTEAFAVPNGTLSPGASPGILNISSLALNGASVTDIEIGGTTPGLHDQINATGSVDLAGTVNLSLFGGFVPAVCDQFEIITGSPVAGTFATVNGAVLPGGITLVPIYQADRVVLVASSTGEVLTRSAGSATVTEGGATDIYSVCLGADPTADIFIDTNDAAGQTTTSSDPIVFTVGGPVVQVITVTAVDDAVDEASPHAATIVHTTTSADFLFNGAQLDALPVSIIDDDESPFANDDLASVANNTTVTIVATANDTDADGDLDPTSVKVTTPPTNGSAVVLANGSIVYDPVDTFVGNDTITYTVDDLGGNDSDFATITITVTPAGANTPPVAVADLINTDERTRVVVDVLANDTDADGDTLSIAAFDRRTAEGATITVLADGRLAYDPPGVAVTRPADAIADASTTTTTGSTTSTTTTNSSTTTTFAGADTDAEAPATPVTTSTTSPGDQPLSTSTTTSEPTDAPPSGETTTDSPTTTTTPTADDDPAATTFDVAALRSSGEAPRLHTAASAILRAAELWSTPRFFTAVSDEDASATRAFIGTDTFGYTITDGNGGFASGTVTVTVGPVIVITVPVTVPPTTPVSSPLPPAPAAPPAPADAPAPTSPTTAPADEVAGPLLPPDEVEPEPEEPEPPVDEPLAVRAVAKGEPLSFTGIAVGCDGVEVIDADGAVIGSADTDADGAFNVDVDTLGIAPGIRDLEIECADDGKTIQVVPVAISQPVDNSGPGSAGAMVVLVMFAMIGAMLVVGSPPPAAELPDKLRDPDQP